MRLPISPHSLAPFVRYGDLLAENCVYLLLLSHSAPRGGNQSHGLLCGENCMILSSTVFLLIHPCDRRTTRLTIQYNTIQYTEDLYSAAIQKCPGALTIVKYIKTKIKSICGECTLEQKCLKLFLEYICVRTVLQVLR